MELFLDRRFKGADYTVGSLYVNGQYFCDTLEDRDRGLRQSMSLDEIAKRKIKGKTAIPRGLYEVTLDVVSPKYATRDAYKFCGGKVPRLLDVPGFSGILIHIGNDATDTEGCLLVGENKVKGQVINSTKTFLSLYETLSGAKDVITIEIV